jgi:hypothetical protein
MPLTRTKQGWAGIGLAAALGCLAAGGCTTTEARLWADTAEVDGSLSLASHQYAYDGEPVILELEVPPGSAQYVLFGVGKDEIVVNTPMIPGRFRLTHTFHCGAKPQTFEIVATPLLIRGKCDWIFDDAEGKWLYYPGHNDKPDIATAPDCTMKITCYRVEAKIAFKARGGPPKRATLSLIKADGKKVNVPMGMLTSRSDGVGSADPKGFLIYGPDSSGKCEVVYSPKYDEVSRAGKTLAELVVEHSDGTLERLEQERDTP